jgi:hypothetical protein
MCVCMYVCHPSNYKALNRVFKQAQTPLIFPMPSFQIFRSITRVCCENLLKCSRQFVKTVTQMLNFYMDKRTVSYFNGLKFIRKSIYIITLALNTEAANISETSVNFCNNTRHIPKEKLSSHLCFLHFPYDKIVSTAAEPALSVFCSARLEQAREKSNRYVTLHADDAGVSSCIRLPESQYQRRTYSDNKISTQFLSESINLKA